MARALAVAVAVAALVMLWAGRIGETPIQGDAAQGLRMALSLERHDVMSLRTLPPYEPTMYREPLPAVATAVMIALHDALRGARADDDYFAGAAARFIKLQNVFWMLLLCGGVFLSVQFISGSKTWAAACVLLVNVQVPLTLSGLRYIGLDTLETDLPAAALLMLGSGLLAKGMHQRNAWLLALAGTVFGTLALTKAAFLYVFLVVAFLLSAAALLAYSRGGGRRSLAGPAVAILAFCVVVAGWMYRNYARFGVLGISERGGVVLLIRAFKDGMTPIEYRGAFHAWAPNGVRPGVGRLLGFTAADLNQGGRLQRLNRGVDADFYAKDVAAEAAGRADLAITYYRKARAERVRLRRELSESGRDVALADGLLKDEALAMIRKDPLAHLSLTAPFLWRGAFFAFPALILAWGYAVVRRRFDVYWFVLPALGLVIFYATLSHFIPRYGLPMHPVALSAAVILMHGAWKRWSPLA